ncbi:MAG: hypothetical protein K9G58_13710 [Bacteroidales bacterium]|nr:hypothetical protein [Bacteroidales bacterium]MCF8388786.1 hypothetical protein [Bacteroidales bacterium]MCF8399226.1 hypothetical protein [Bacteroidales bacterium]
MKKLSSILILALLIGICFFSCKKIDDTGDGIKIYTIDEDITNPPDSFLLQYNLKTNINYSVNIQLGQDSGGSVWMIRKVNSFNARFWITRPKDDSIFYIQDETIIGLKNDIYYRFYANNNNYQDLRKLTVKFNKLNYNYDTFNNKF